jgi:hypothetical protein
MFRFLHLVWHQVVSSLEFNYQLRWIERLRKKERLIKLRATETMSELTFTRLLWKLSEFPLDRIACFLAGSCNNVNLETSNRKKAKLEGT